MNNDKSEKPKNIPKFLERLLDDINDNWHRWSWRTSVIHGIFIIPANIVLLAILYFLIEDRNLLFYIYLSGGCVMSFLIIKIVDKWLGINVDSFKKPKDKT